MSPTSTGGHGGGHTIAFDKAHAQKIRQALPQPGRTGIFEMAAIGDTEGGRGDDDAGQQELYGEKPTRRVIFMRHGESEWNRCALSTTVDCGRHGILRSYCSIYFCYPLSAREPYHSICVPFLCAA